MIDELAVQGYWPANAARHLAEGRYSNAVEICSRHLQDNPRLTSGRLIYATALYLAGQVESATEQFYHVLSQDPDNIMALKYLGDINYAGGDVPAAMAKYQRVIEIDPRCRGLKCALKHREKERTRTIALRRGEETAATGAGGATREVLFFTETMGDLYLAQGYPRLAVKVFRRLNEDCDNPRLHEKLREAEKKAGEREH